MTFSIESDVPVPQSRETYRVGRGRPLLYPWHLMEVNNSIVVEDNPASAVKAARSYGKKHGLKFTHSYFERDGVSRVRIWRIA